MKTSNKDGDIDIVCVVPKFIDREKHFFSELKEILLSIPNVKINPLKDARVPVPILKTKFDINRYVICKARKRKY